MQYLRTKLDLGARGNPYGATIAKAMDAFYAAPGAALNKRVRAQTGAKVISVDMRGDRYARRFPRSRQPCSVCLFS